MDEVAVTGAAGFVGSAVVRALLARGRHVRALLEPGADTRNLAGLEVERVECDITQPAQVKRALAGCASLFHLAAIYKLWVPDPEPLYRVNVEGTTNVLLAALQAGIRRVVHTSSIMAIGLADSGPTDESQRFNIFDIAGPYTMTKYVSERIALRFAQAGLPLTVVAPSMPFGPGDRAPTPTGQIVLGVLRGEVPAIGTGLLSVVDVDDCATGHLLAEEKGAVGERYILTSHDVTLKDFIGAVGRVAGMKVPRLVIPRALGVGIAAGMESYARHVSHAEPMVTLNEARFTARMGGYSGRRARDELGMPSRPLEETLSRAVAWFRAEGMA